ncbi:MAG: ABC transporter ATP-binding protein [Eubacteriales bacterium]|nr:ABC transporter ATP-binding protein [Eubacteriales bacterium]NLV70421.1 ABC transporter ATP-binding protein [Clostridiales bacterium]HPF19435.1 ABC transporter ATP-binding protein [Bacillota bacterium]HRV33107.1 ABC transporter ATP-binding protein [Anaerovoracaceae bacterium]MDD3536640.1 ABC transporter ATP-binding protein [Eubacteriales bacterium]
MNTEVRNLSFSYGEQPILQDVSFCLNGREVVSVLSPNGGGKTTLFRCMLGIHRQYTGIITYDERDSRNLSIRNLARYAAYVPQSHYPAFNYNVLDMVLMGTTPLLRSTIQPGEEEYEIAEQALARLGISTLARRGFIRLSGGEQRLVLIARALAQQAPMIILDEPTADLDIGNQHLVMTQLRRLRDEGMTILFSTHDPSQAYRWSDRVLALSEQSIYAEGPPARVICSPVLNHLYHIDATVVPLDDRDIHIQIHS